MNNITNSDIEMHIKRAAEDMTPDMAEQLWQKPVEQSAGGEWYLDGTAGARRRGRSLIRAIAAAAACLILFVFALYQLNYRTDATVYLDVNPGVSLRINRSEKVIKAEASNRDGEIILDEMNLRNTDLDVAVNALLGSMVKHGYISEAQNMILLSVDGRDPQRTEELRIRLSGEIDDCLSSLIGSGVIFDQTIQTDDELNRLAERYGVTPGKAYLLQKLVGLNPELDYSELAGLTMNELSRRLKRENIDLRDYTGPPPAAEPSTEPATEAAVGRDDYDYGDHDDIDDDDNDDDVDDIDDDYDDD